MNELKEIFNDFYCLFSLPIHLLDSNMNVVHSMGYTEDTHKIIDGTSIYKDIRKNMLCPVNITYFDNIHFIVIPILISCPIGGTLVIGPFRSEYVCTELNLPFKPISCTRYICYILNDMFIKKFKPIKSYGNYVDKSLRYINNFYNIDLKISDVCEYLNINKSYFCYLFKKETGYTFTGYLNKVRIDKSKDLLVNNNLSILDVALKVGFNNHNYFTTTFRKLTGSSPLEYRKLYSL